MIDFGKKLNSTQKLGIDTIFSSGENATWLSADNVIGVTEVSIYELIPYSRNPFKPYDGERLEEMEKSILRYGILQPILVREMEGSSKYEILAGHNRYNVAKILSEKDESFLKVPVRILKEIDDDTAELIVSESNMMQRSLNDLLPSEKAFVIATYYKAEKKQGKRTDLIHKVSEILGQENTEEAISGKKKAAIEFNISPMSIARYSRIDTLAENLKEKLNEGLIDLVAAYNLSFRTEDEQFVICKYQEEKKLKIDRKKSLEIKKLNEVTVESLDEIFAKSKSSSYNSIDRTVKKYFPDKNKEEIILILNELLKKYSEEHNEESN